MKKFIYTFLVTIFLASPIISKSWPLNLSDKISDRLFFAKQINFSSNLMSLGFSWSGNTPASLVGFSLVDTKTGVYAGLNGISGSFIKASYYLQPHIGISRQLKENIKMNSYLAYFDGAIPDNAAGNNEMLTNGFWEFHSIFSFDLKKYGSLELEYGRYENLGQAIENFGIVNAKNKGFENKYLVKYTAPFSQTALSYIHLDTKFWGSTIQLDQPLFSFRGALAALHYSSYSPTDSNQSLLGKDTNSRVWIDISMTF